MPASGKDESRNFADGNGNHPMQSLSRGVLESLPPASAREWGVPSEALARQRGADDKRAAIHLARKLPGIEGRPSYPVSSTASIATGFFARVVVITTTLTRTNRVPRTVRRPSASPPRKYPSSTATT